MGLFSLLGKALAWVFKIIALPFVKLKQSPQGGRILRWALHALAILVILVGLGVLNYALDLAQVLRVPVPALRQVWLPLLFALVYLLCWQGWWLWKLFQTRVEPSAFPDLDAAWSNVRQRLEQAGIDLNAKPLFLLLGHPHGLEQSLFNATRQPLVIPLVPRDPDAPFRVCATAEGIYVSCSNTSLLGSYATEIRSLIAEETSTENTSWNDYAATTATSDDELVAHEGGIAVTSPPTPTIKAAPIHRRQRVSTLRDVQQLEAQLARLRHVCRLIEADRKPYCPLNGLVLLIPFEATTDEFEANQVATLIEQDLKVVDEVMQVSCPLVVTVCDLEQVQGCHELLARFPDEQRHRRLGLRFPHVVTCDRDHVPHMIEQGIKWIADNLLPPLVYRLLQIQPNQTPDSQNVWHGNARLYQFLQTIRNRQASLARIILRGVWNDGRSPWLLSGCYFLATGSDAAREQGFVADLFPQLHEMQNRVAWTEQALADNHACQRWTRVGYAMLATFLVGIVTLVLDL